MARTALLLPLLAAALAACVAAQQDAAASAAARAVAAAAAVSDRLASEQLGCVKDSQAARGLPTALGSGAMTPAKCRGLALAKKLKFYALQGGNDCWCAAAPASSPSKRRGRIGLAASSHADAAAGAPPDGGGRVGCRMAAIQPAGRDVHMKTRAA